MKKFHIWLIGVLALCFDYSGAFAQCGPAGSVGLSSATAFSSTLNTANTAFGTQTSAFVGGPGGTQANQWGGGVWGRAIFGQVTNSATGTVTFPGAGTFQCTSKFRSNFGGFQAGQDIARFNVGDGRTDIHVGLTEGYLSASGNETTGLASGRFDLPFIGAYASVGREGFFADILFREDFMSGNITQPQVGLAQQAVTGRASSITGSAGYQFPIGNSSFVEPSGTLVWANFIVDPVPVAGSAPVLPGTLFSSDIHSTLGRVGIRVGTTLNTGYVVLTPFASANVWHEFDGNTTSNFACAGCAGFSLSTSRVGTFGQYSVGTAASIPNTGWLGYVRVDYRQGADLTGYGVNAGIRYQFIPL
jgi:hypothetical protein